MAEQPAPNLSIGASSSGQAVVKKKFAAPPVKSACLAWYVMMHICSTFSRVASSMYLSWGPNQNQHGL